MRAPRHRSYPSISALLCLARVRVRNPTLTLTFALTLSRCVLPDMSALLCDGPVLVEAGLQVGGDVARSRRDTARYREI